MSGIKVKLNCSEKVLNETLTRMGIPDYKKLIIYPSCYLYNNFGDYYIVHFKEMFLIERQQGYNNLTEQDIERRNSIAFCLDNWGLVDIDDDQDIEPHKTRIFVLSYKYKDKWKVAHKFRSNYKD